MRPNKDRRTEIILYGLLLIPLLFAAAALAQATEQTQGLAEITAVLSEILHTPSMLRWCFIHWPSTAICSTKQIATPAQSTARPSGAAPTD